MIYTKFETILTGTTVSTLIILSLHAWGVITIPLLDVINQITGIKSSYPVAGMFFFGVLFIMLGIFAGIIFAGDRKFSRIGDSDDMEAVIYAFTALWVFISVFYFS